MPTPFIFGIDPAIDGSALLSSADAFDRVGHNIGNLAFHYAVRVILGRQTKSLSWYAPPQEINDAGGIGVLPCANQLGPHLNYGSLAERFTALKLPLAAVGLGAQGASDYQTLCEVPAGTLNWVREIIARAPSSKPNITLRGDYTLKVLAQYGLDRHAVVLGCPSLFINPDPDLGAKIAQRATRPATRIAIAAGHQKWLHLAKIEASLTRIMAATDGVYIVQSPLEMALLARGDSHLMSAQSLTACRDYACPELSLPEFVRWSRRYARAFFDVSAWMEYLRGFDFVVGARIHGVMLGLQAGIPSLCIAHDSRTRELCETMMVPFVMARDVSGGITRDRLHALFTFDAAAFDANRRRLGAALNDFLVQNEIDASPVLGRIAGAHAPAALKTGVALGV